MRHAAYQKIEAIHAFENVRRRAQWGRWWRRLTGRPQTLLPFALVRDQLPRRAARNRGVREIPLDAIAGSVGRAGDYDRRFRPHKDGLRDRWVMARLRHQASGWEPIVVYQVGDVYFVEDGHHRVSVARAAGLTAIEARVYHYPAPVDLSPEDNARSVMKKLRAARRPAPAPESVEPAPMLVQLP